MASLLIKPSFSADSTAKEFEDSVNHDISLPSRMIASEALREKYSERAKSFHSVRDCLEESEKFSANPNLEKFNWEIFESTVDAEICIYRVAAAYKNPEAMLEWLKRQGIKAYINQRANGAKTIHGNWSIGDDAGSIAGGPMKLFFLKYASNGYSLGIEHNASGEAISVNIVVNML